MNHSPMNIEIALRPFLAGGRAFNPCDRFDPAKVADITSRTADMLRRQGTIGPLTRETYERLISLRAPGTIPFGFTAQFLVEHGIIDEKPEPKRKEVAQKRVEKMETRMESDEDFPGGIIGRPRKTGVSIWWSLFDAVTGDLIYDKAFNGRAKAEAAAAEYVALRDAGQETPEPRADEDAA